MREHERDYSHNAILDLYKANRVTAQELSDLWNRLPSAPVLKHTTQVPLVPVQGMFVVDPVEQAFCFYLGEEWICLHNTPFSHAIKINGDKKSNKVGDVFKFPIDPLLDGKVLTLVGVFNGTAGSGSTTITVANHTRTLTLATAVVGSGVTSNFGATIDTGGSANNPHNMVHLGDDIWITCTGAAAGSKGLGCFLYFDYFEEPVT